MNCVEAGGRLRHHGFSGSGSRIAVTGYGGFHPDAAGNVDADDSCVFAGPSIIA